ncbi:MAG: peptidylprolyl isomerase [Caulobacterales bacterium]|nr:peptidylprolyl isomerase [Caulobacterales bacterium]
MRLLACLISAFAVLSTPVLAQSSDWRTIDPDNLLVIETTRGRILIEMVPEAAPGHVERMRVLTRRGFYDGVSFHRVMAGFMAQTGDPQGTGEGGSDLPDMAAEFSFRRGGELPYAEVTGTDRGFTRPGGVQLGLFGPLPVQTQPDGQMFATRDGRVDATAWFCPGVVGAARTAQNINTANSQFYIMTAPNMSLNGQYTVWGRVIGSMDAVNLLQTGDPVSGLVPVDQRDRMTRVRIASDIPAAERPVARVLDVSSPRFAQLVDEQRAARGTRFSVCDLSLPSDIEN